MKVEEQIKKAAKEFIIKVLPSYNGYFIDEEDTESGRDLAGVAFTNGANFGRELGVKEAFEWICLNDKSPEVRSKPYKILAKDNTLTFPIEKVELISMKEDVQYVELNYTHFRYINQEDML